MLDGVMRDVGFRYDREERVINLAYFPREITGEMYLSYDIRRAIVLAGGVQRLTALFQTRMRSGIPMPI